MAIKAIFFDAAGTLIKPARRVGESYAALAGKYGIRVAPAEVSARFRVCFEGASPLAFPGATPDAISGLEQNWWKHLVTEVFAPFGPFKEFDAFFDELFAYFARPDSWELFPESIETLQALRERGLKRAVISNFDSRLLNILDGLGAASWFDAIFVSSAVGYAKPDRRIFEFALEAQQLAAPAALHIGDSVTNDVGGAANAGVKGILVDRKPSRDADATPRVANLKEILAHID
jgi:putative hydrolase of the HAD superfamily